MSGLGTFGLLWAGSGMFLGFRWWRERQAEPHGAAVARSVSASRRFGEPLEDGSGRRVQAMRLAYAAGALATGGGFLLEVGFLLALGAGLVNLGTIYRYLVVALDREMLDAPVLAGTRRFLLPEALDRPLA